MKKATDNPRREVQTRSAVWARTIADMLARAGVRPNTISMLSIFFALAAGALLFLAGKTDFPANSILLVATTVLIGLRLVCNLLDGMVAVEGGLGTPSGKLFNDFPDRIADPVLLVCAGYAAHNTPYAVELGWIAGMLAVYTAYVRVLAGASGAEQRFTGPMAKQHRMALLVVALLTAAVVAGTSTACHGIIITAVLAVIAGGCAITSLRRLLEALREMESDER